MPLPKFEQISELADINIGFDTSVEPPWMMVPLGAEKIVALLFADGVTVTSANPQVVEIVGNVPLAQAATNRRITLKGKTAGKTFIEAKKNGVVLASLEVDVLREKTVNLAFRFVKDIANHNTIRAGASIVNLISDLNGIYLPQANIRFQEQSRKIVTVQMNLKEEVNFPEDLYTGKIKKGRREWDAITALGDPTAYVNIFFVWKLETNENLACQADCSDTIGYHAFKNIMIEDKVLLHEFTVTAAHEVGHALGVVGHNNNSDFLMYASVNESIRFSGLEATKMNHSIK